MLAQNHQVRPVPKCKLLGIVVAELLQARCPSYHPTNSVKALYILWQLDVFKRRLIQNVSVCTVLTMMFWIRNFCASVLYKFIILLNQNSCICQLNIWLRVFADLLFINCCVLHSRGMCPVSSSFMTESFLELRDLLPLQRLFNVGAGGTCTPRFTRCPPDSKASWKNVGLYGVRLMQGGLKARSFYKPDTPPVSQPTALQHWRIMYLVNCYYINDTWRPCSLLRRSWLGDGNTIWPVKFPESVLGRMWSKTFLQHFSRRR